MEWFERKVKCEIYNDNFQNFKRYNIPKAQLVIADIPYNLGKNAYASSPEWYNGGDNSNGESKKAHKSFFNTDNNFNPPAGRFPEIEEDEAPYRLLCNEYPMAR